MTVCLSCLSVCLFVCLFVCFSDSKITLERVMEQIASQVNDYNTVHFSITRRNVWDGASRAMGRSNFSPEKKIDVKFTDYYGISEVALDNGGPTREFFRLCLQEVKDNIGIFEGLTSAKFLTCNSKGTCGLSISYCCCYCFSLFLLMDQDIVTKKKIMLKPKCFRALYLIVRLLCYINI